MITISKKIEYSVIILKYLALKQGERISLARACRILKLPYRFMSQVMVSLKEEGIVDSREGKKGGYSLVKGWENRSLYDLVEALGENKGMVECLAHKGECSREGKCQIKGVWKSLEEKMLSNLKEIRLVEVTK